MSNKRKRKRDEEPEELPDTKPAPPKPKVCPECVAEGRVSHILIGARYTLGRAPSQFYDAAGALHVHDPDGHFVPNECSCGHTWEEREHFICPTCQAVAGNRIPVE